MRATHLATEALVAELTDDMERVMGRDADTNDAAVDVVCDCGGMFCIFVTASTLHPAFPLALLRRQQH